MELNLEFNPTEKAANFLGTLLDSGKEIVEKITSIVPDIFLALGIIIFGIIFGNIVSWGIQKIGEKLKIIHIFHRIGFTKLLQKANIQSSPSAVIGKFAQGYIITISIISAANVFGFYQVSDFLDKVIKYIPNVLVSLVIILFGTGVAETSSAILENTLRIAKSKAARTLALSAKYIIITFAIMAALFELKIAEELVQILFTGFIAMIALAGGLAFGLGGKDVVREVLEDLKKMPEEEKK
ncbi:hypothetical protein HZA38_01305 [Candidatus Peregrinibacteria bacterium]|nr:hypothetical protein [Candidatus Peregrinibacteria bacterium]